SWIFEHFPKLPDIPTPNQSGTAEFCTRWSWTKTTSAQSGSATLNMFREALDSYKLQDVVWDPYLEKREDKHNFKEVASFKGLLYSPEHNKLYYPDRVQRLFNRRQPVPRAPTCVEQSGLRLGDEPCTYKLKYNWKDLFSEGKWRDSINLTRNVVNLAEDDDYDDGRVLGDRGGVSQRENVEVPHSQNEGGGGPGEVSFGGGVGSVGECVFLMEANLRMQADVQEKDIANSICDKKLNEKVKKCKTLSSINDKLMEEVYVNQEAQPLPGVRRLALKGTIEG
ncbi:hypothetical protein GIB67_014246, partial [Kingdonia uniflora]